MADSANQTAAPDGQTVPPSKIPIASLVVAIVAGVLLSVLALAGMGFYLLKSGRIALPSSTASTPVKVESAPLPSTHALMLEPLVVNLADEGGKSYLRLGLTLRVEDEESKDAKKPKEEKPKQPAGPSEAEAAVRDTVLIVLGGHTSVDLLAPDGKERLKKELKASIQSHDPNLKLNDIFFTEFLVQR